MWKIYQDSPEYGCSDNPSYQWFVTRSVDGHIVQNAGPFADRAAAEGFITSGNLTPAPLPTPWQGRHGYNPVAVNKAIDASNRSGRRIGAAEAKAIHALLKGRH